MLISSRGTIIFKWTSVFCFGFFFANPFSFLIYSGVELIE